MWAVMAHSDESLVKLLREGWRGDTAANLMREAADRIEVLRRRAGVVEVIRRDVYRPLVDALRLEASLGPTIEPGSGDPS